MRKILYLLGDGSHNLGVSVPCIHHGDSSSKINIFAAIYVPNMSILGLGRIDGLGRDSPGYCRRMPSAKRISF
jgi:hypothetical protein